MQFLIIFVFSIRIPKTCDPKAKELIELIFVRNRLYRPSAQQCLENCFFDSYVIPKDIPIGALKRPSVYRTFYSGSESE